jgi:hypothetical protein
MDEIGAGKNNRAIIFLVPSINVANGGILSQFYIAEETERLKNLHGADVFICSNIGGVPLFRNTKFPNNRGILDFTALLRRFPKGAEILLQIPEIYVGQVLSLGREQISSPNFRWNFNVMLQNIDYIPTRTEIASLSKFGPVTVTTAHEAYSGIETQQALGCPVHHLSAWGNPKPFERRKFSERENIFVISPDAHPRRKEIISELKRRLPNFRFITVSRMTYFEYLDLIAKAKFSLTFGEGLDGFFAEMIFSGGIGCAVYNTRFFTEKFIDLPFVYPSWDTLLTRLPDDVQSISSAAEYVRMNEIPHQLLRNISSPEILREKTRTYYRTYFQRKDN